MQAQHSLQEKLVLPRRRHPHSTYPVPESLPLRLKSLCETSP